jgi:DNA-binding transcriptional MerR regulator
MLTIGELADLMKISTSSIRYYEKMGLISPQKTDHNGYRLYDIGEVDRMDIILVLRGLDISIAKIKPMLDGYQIDDYLDILSDSLGSLDREIQKLNNKKDYIKKKIQSALHLKEFGNTYQIHKMDTRLYRRLHEGKLFDYNVKEVYEILKAKDIQWLDSKHEYQIISSNYRIFHLCTKENELDSALPAKDSLILPAGYYLTYGFFIEPSEHMEEITRKEIRRFEDHIRTNDLQICGDLITMENLHCSEFNLQKLYFEIQWQLVRA